MGVCTTAPQARRLELPSDVSVPPTVGAGTIPGHFSVTHAGSASYDIPLDVPPGRNGIEPELSLRYNGSRGNGMLGVGWALDGLSATAEGVLTLVLLLDQFPRNLYRDAARAYASDSKARAVARLAVGMGLDKLLSPVERIFIYLPFEHSEAVDDQIRSVALFKTLPVVPWRDEVIDYAIRHHDIVAQFGRFPHRNAMLGRTSTAEELAFLEEQGAVF